MQTEIIINAVREETRVALIENRVITEIYFDRKKDRGILGNVYKGKVVKVLPGMQAAFVDIGMEKAAFLYVADVFTEPEKKPEKKPKKEPEDGKPVDSEKSSEDEEAGEDGNGDGNGDNDVEEEGEGEDDLDLEETEEAPVRVLRRSKKRSLQPIGSLLKEGAEIVVQVSKEPIGTKGPRVTTYVSLPGRYLVYMPMVNHVGVSRRITKEEERRRLKEMIHKHRKKGHGYIVRTVSDGTTEDEFKQDMHFLEGVWENIMENKEKLSSPALLHNDLDLIIKTVRDFFTEDVKRLIIDSKREYERIKEFVGKYLPVFLPRITLWNKSEPIFDAYGVELEISKARNRRVWLKSGGYIVIDRAEALTVIDVNTGRFVGKRDLEETIFKTNMEAAKETACQLRLRNIGGIIVIDLIDMDKEKNREKVMQALHEALKNDKAKTNVLKLSELGLVQMSRERRREDLLSILCLPCPYCDGRGQTKSPTTVSHELFREIRRIGASPRDRKIMIGVHPTVAMLLFDEARQEVELLEKEFKKKIIIKADSNLHIEKYDIVTL